MSTHYQTCFYVRYAPDVYHRHSVFSSLQNRLRTWICKKEKVSKLWKALPEFQKAFMRQVDCTFPSDNTCVTEVHKEVSEERTTIDMWSMRYTEYKKEQNWITEVGIRRIDSETSLVYVKVSYNYGRFSLESQTPPLPSVPRFITQLIADGRHKVFLANENDAAIIPIQSGCIKVSSTRAVSLLYENLIHSCLRRYVIIVANGDYKAENEAQRLYQGLLGKALVVYLEKCDAVKEALDDIPLEYRVPFNHVRIFYPVEERGFDRTISCDAMETNRKAVVSMLLSAFVLDNSEAIKTLETVKHFNALSLAQEQIKKTEESQSTNPEDGEGVEELKEFIDELCKEIEEKQKTHKKELERQVQETKRYKDRVDVLGAVVEEKKRELIAAYNQNRTLAALAYPGSIAEIMNFFANLFPQRLVILDEAIESANQYTAFKEFSRAWELMSALSINLYKMKYEDEDGMINETTFKNDTGYEITMSESRMTSRDANLANQRKRNYKGKVYDISPHIKWGNKPPKCLRLHFAFVEDEKKILIGYFGEHLDNYSTRKRKN